MDRPSVFQGVKESSYDIAKFYTRATNDHDHSMTMRVPMPREIMGEISRWVQMGLVPAYTSPQALVRDAVHHRLQWLAEQKGDWELAGVLSVQRGLDAQERILTRLATEEKFLAGVKKVIAELEGTHRLDMLETYLDQVEIEEHDIDERSRMELVKVIADGRDLIARGRRRADG